ncbi:MAG: hypothetical protein G01um101444_322 [Parcubacteria group bacterium Gr01-1014_44]|nr:MAG: hypothetical protein G01um101444_322 [Parcubacteria group bacterium Gr01-1014_44]
MHIDDIQKLIDELGAAVIVGEDGPKMIAMSYDTYRAMMADKGNGLRRENHRGFVPAVTDHDKLAFPEQLAIRAEKSSGEDPYFAKASKGEPYFAKASKGEQELIEKLNQDIAILKEEIKKKELGEL